MAGTPICDEIHKFMDAIQKEAPKVASAFEKTGQAFQGWQVHIEEWGRQFGRNQLMFGVELQSRAELERQTRREKLRKELEKCLHGRTKFEIRWGAPLRCPQCYNNHVYVDSERIWCLLCGWSKWRIGKRPS